MMMVVVMVVVVVLHCYHLRLRRDWNREAEDSDEPEQKLFHG
jgi:hypothetical protein